MPELTVRIRKILTVVEEAHQEMGRPITPPSCRAAALAVIENPFAGRYVEDLSPLITIGEELGFLLAKRAVAALGAEGEAVQSYGKAAAVGADGELEHAAAILHPKLGAPFRAVLGGGAALIPSSKKRGGPGIAFDIPLGHKDAAFVRSHFDGNGGPCHRRPARERDRRCGGSRTFRPSAAPRRRPAGARGEGRGRVALARR